MREVGAWLLQVAEARPAAVGERELLHVLPDGLELFEIPHSPVYCRQLLVWRGEPLPVMDLAVRLFGRPAGTTPVLLGLTAFRPYPGARMQQGVLRLCALPKRIRVKDAEACSLPAEPPGWRQLASACFEQPEHGTVPILDLARVFAPPPQAPHEDGGHKPLPGTRFETQPQGTTHHSIGRPT